MMTYFEGGYDVEYDGKNRGLELTEKVPTLFAIQKARYT
jgi:hypothetical protein